MGWVINCLFLISLHASSSRKVIIKDDTMRVLSLSASQINGKGVLWDHGDNPVTTCGDGRDADFWLFLKHINLRDIFADAIYVNLEAGKFTTCHDPKIGKQVPCHSDYFQIYIYRGENLPNILNDKTALKKFLRRHFTPVFNITNNLSPTAHEDSRFNQTFSFLQNKSEGVTFGIRSRGACGEIYRLKMYYYFCKETSINSIKFSKTVSPASGYKEVLGNCSRNSSLSKYKAGPSGRCYSNGSWIISGKIHCSCIQGFEPIQERGCSPCKVNHYKPNVSNSNCEPCPLNNLSTRNKTACKCQEGHYKLNADHARLSPCYGLLMMSEKPKISQSGRGRINITWEKPKKDTVFNDTVTYKVQCYFCVESVCNRSCTGVTYNPNPQYGLTQRSVVVSNLKPGTIYVFRIYPKNRLNDVVVKEKWNFTTTEYVTINTTTDTLQSEENTSHIIIIIGVFSGLLSFLIVFLIVIILRRKRSVKKSPITRNKGDVLLSTHQKMYIDPWKYERPEDAVCEFARELEPTSVTFKMMIGGGEFGDVYKGNMKRHDGSTFLVAVKTLKSDASSKSELDFLLEASVMGQFDNPNVIQLEGVVTKSQPHMIVTEFMSNGSLDNFLKIKDGMLSQLQLIGMARGVAAGMKYLARMKFVHRDLAARNILVNDSLLCKVSDFGLSRGLETTDSSRGEYATSGGKIPVRWTAPEAIKYRKFSSASDVWSYGILLWEIMSFAKRPYWDWDNFQVIEKLDNGFRLPAPLKCPKGVHDLMLLCWKENRGERPNFVDITRVIDGWIISPETIEDEVDFSSNLGEWLLSIKMKIYVTQFSAAGYENPTQLFGLGEVDLKRMGITLVGHRNKILKSLRSLKAEMSKEMFEVENSVDV